MTASRATSPCFNCLTKRFPVHLKQFNLFTTPCWKHEICCVILIVPRVFTGKVLKIQLDWKFSWIFHSQQPLVLSPNYENSMTPTVIERDEWWWSQILKLPFPYSRVLFHLRFSMKRFFLLLLSTRNLVHAPKLITCRMNGRELWKRNPLFWKAHPHSFKHSHRERFPGGQKVRTGFTFTAKLWSFTTSNKMTNSCDGKLFSPNFLLALKRRH